jgi:hypothetical protein
MSEVCREFGISRLVGAMAKYVQHFLLQRRLPHARVVPSLFGTVVTNVK